MPPTWIAEEPVVFVHPDGERVAGRIAIGMPVWIDANGASCAISLDGFETFRGPIHGGSPLQALLLAARLLGMRLHDFRSRGGRVLYPGGGADEDEDAEVPLEAIFGPYLAPPGPVPSSSG